MRTYRPIANPVDDVTVNTVDEAFDAADILVEVAVDKSKLTTCIGFAPLDGYRQT
jgi:hypothetical protein